MIANNYSYKNIAINYHLFDIWDNKFISFGITNNIVNCNFDYYKHLGYIANIYKNNHEKYLYATIVDKKINKNYIHSDYIYSDINYGRQNLTLQLLSTIGNIKTTNLSSNFISLFIIFYCNKNRLVLLNHWKYLHYFTLAFSCLFLNKMRSYLEKEK